MPPTTEDDQPLVAAVEPQVLPIAETASVLTRTQAKPLVEKRDYLASLVMSHLMKRHIQGFTSNEDRVVIAEAANEIISLNSQLLMVRGLEIANVEEACRAISVLLQPNDMQNSSSASSTATNSNSASASQAEYHMMANNPLYDTRKFDGARLSFPSFWESFNRTVDDQNIPVFRKWNALINSVDSETRTMFTGERADEQGYRSVRAKMERKFFDRHQNHNHVSDTIAKLSILPDYPTAAAFRKFCSVVKDCFALLKVANAGEFYIDETFRRSVFGKLPPRIRNSYIERSMENKTAAALIEFIENKVMVAEEYESMTPLVSTAIIPRQRHVGAIQRSSPQDTRRPRNRPVNQQQNVCTICSGIHHRFRCNFGNPGQRENLVRERNLCRLCLLDNHTSSQCASSYQCNKCGERHSSTICAVIYQTQNSSTQSRNNTSGYNSTLSAPTTLPTDTALSNNQPAFANQDSSTSNQQCATRMTFTIVPERRVHHLDDPESVSHQSQPYTKRQRPDHVYHQTCLAKINGHVVRVLIDSGSGGSFIEARVVKRINLKTQKDSQIKLTWIGKNSMMAGASYATVDLMSIDGSESMKFNLDVIDSFGDIRLESADNDIRDSLRQHGIVVADIAANDQNSLIDIILGVDYFHSVWKNKRVMLSNELAAELSYLGWVVSGPKNANQPLKSAEKKVHVLFSKVFTVGNLMQPNHIYVSPTFKKYSTDNAAATAEFWNASDQKHSERHSSITCEGNNRQQNSSVQTSNNTQCLRSTISTANTGPATAAQSNRQSTIAERSYKSLTRIPNMVHIAAIQSDTQPVLKRNRKKWPFLFGVYVTVLLAGSLVIINPCSNSPTRIPTTVYIAACQSNSQPALANQVVPLILHRNSTLTWALLNHYHISNGHSGCSRTMALFCAEYFTLKLRQLTRSIIAKCVTCQRMNQAALQVPMGEPPSDRVSIPSRAFESIGIDLFGPIKFDKGRRKFYGIIFCCCTTRAIHLELIEKENTKVCFDAFRRFIARRGIPSTIFSDNGPNLVKLDKTLKTLHKELLKTEDYSAAFNIRWVYQPPYTPWRGGLFERLIKVVRETLTKINFRKSPTLAELQTILIEVESIINSRPLTINEDQSVLTPAHFLVGERLNKIPNISSNMDVRSSDVLQLYKHHQRTLNGFWRHWSNQYIMSLKNFQRNSSTYEVAKINEVVLYRKPNTPRASWPLARVLQTYEGSDGRIRTYDLLLQTGETKVCSAQHISRLEFSEPGVIEQ